VPTPASAATLRQCALAVSVLADIDLLPRDDGVVVTGSRSDGHGDVLVDWTEFADALGDHEPLSATGCHRVGTLLRLCRVVADHGDRPDGAPALIRRATRALALPPDHALHPGGDWLLGRVRGEALDLGVGVLGLAGQPDDARPLPPSLARRLRLRPDRWWPDLIEHVERMGRLAAARIVRDGSPVLRPVGGCDPLTLLASPPLREQLATADGTGMRAVAAPTRRRGWFDLRQVDPAYVAAVWSLTDPPERGLPTPLLVTRHEVVAPGPARQPPSSRGLPAGSESVVGDSASTLRGTRAAPGGDSGGPRRRDRSAIRRPVDPIEFEK
jgi:hypothetical protein